MLKLLYLENALKRYHLSIFHLLDSIYVYKRYLQILKKKQHFKYFICYLNSLWFRI